MNLGFTDTQRVPEEFTAHVAFSDLDACADFYDALSDLVWGHVTRTRSFLGNLDSCFFDSLAGTIESIKAILLAGRIADAYTLLRRFSETAKMQVHVMLRFAASSSDLGQAFADAAPLDLDEFLRAIGDTAAPGVYVEEVEDWLSGAKSIKVHRASQIASPTLQPLHSLFDPSRYKAILDRCNDHVHINFFRNLRQNGPTLDYRPQVRLLEQFAVDFRDLCIWHVAYVFSIRPEYMASSDYIDALECGAAPVEGSQYWVAACVQGLFDTVVSPHRPDVTEFVKHGCCMELS